MSILGELIIILSVSAVVLYISTRLNLPSVVGLLVVGVLVGPYGAALIGSEEAVNEMAEVGILLLLFSIGIEFSLDKLIESRRFVFFGGALQVFLTIFLTGFLAYVLGLEIPQAIFVGMLFAMSSTAIVLQLFGEKGWANTLFGRNTISILIFQDIIIIPMMLLVPYLSGDAQQSEESLWKLGEGILIVVLTVFAARKIIPKILRQIVHTRNQDLFLISVIVICFATAFITHELGLKLALGAFLAGLIISESEYSFEALKNIKPFKKIFTALFFISVGMLLNLTFLMENLGLVIGLTIAIILLKFVIVSVVSYALKIGVQNALISGLALAQVGEFAFILSKVGIDISLITESTYQLFLSISILSMIITAILISKAPALSEKLITIKPFTYFFPPMDDNPCLPVPCSLHNHVLIIGFGPGGQRVADSLLKKGKSVAVIDLNPNNLTLDFKNRLQFFVGDGSDKEVLERAGILDAKEVIITVPEAAVAENITRRVRTMNHLSRIIVRSKYASEVEELERLGADMVVPEELTVAEMMQKAI